MKSRAFTLSVSGAEHLSPNDHVDLVALVEEPNSKELMAFTFLENQMVLKVGPELPSSIEDLNPLRRVTFLMLPEIGEMASLAAKLAKVLHVTLRNPENFDVDEEKGRSTMQTLIISERIEVLLKRRMDKIPCSSRHAASVSPAQAPDRIASSERFSTQTLKKGSAVSVVVSGADEVRVDDHVDFVAIVHEPKSNELMAVTLMQNVHVLAVGSEIKNGSEGPVFPLQRLTLLLLQEEAEILIAAETLSLLQVGLRNLNEMDVLEERGMATLQTLLTGERIKVLYKRRPAVHQCMPFCSKGSAEAEPIVPVVVESAVYDPQHF